jgi:hypothetical protein
MGYEAQVAYQKAGGVSVHKSVLERVDLWREFSYLPCLTALSRRATKRQLVDLKSASYRRSVVSALDCIRKGVRHQNPRSARSDDTFWYDKGYQEQLEQEISAEFQKVVRGLSERRS